MVDSARGWRWIWRLDRLLGKVGSGGRRNRRVVLLGRRAFHRDGQRGRHRDGAGGREGYMVKGDLDEVDIWSTH
jgi:hypothetical protein